MAHAKVVASECSNGHGPMALASDQDGRPIPYERGVDRGHAFVAYQCAACSYREFRDTEVAPEAGAAAAT